MTAGSNSPHICTTSKACYRHPTAKQRVSWAVSHTVLYRYDSSWNLDNAASCCSIQHNIVNRILEGCTNYGIVFESQNPGVGARQSRLQLMAVLLLSEYFKSWISSNDKRLRYSSSDDRQRPIQRPMSSNRINLQLFKRMLDHGCPNESVSHSCQDELRRNGPMTFHVRKTLLAQLQPDRIWYFLTPSNSTHLHTSHKTKWTRLAVPAHSLPCDFHQACQQMLQVKIQPRLLQMRYTNTRRSTTENPQSDWYRSIKHSVHLAEFHALLSIRTLASKHIEHYRTHGDQRMTQRSSRLIEDHYECAEIYIMSYLEFNPQTCR